MTLEVDNYDDFKALLTESEYFTIEEVGSIANAAKSNTLGQALAACRKLKIVLSDMIITDLARRFINA